MNSLEEIVQQFKIDGKYDHYEVIHSGLINATYHIYTTTHEYLLQKVNTSIFQDMDRLMNNIEKVTTYLKEKSIPTLDIIMTKSNQFYYEDYRMYAYIPHSFSYDACDSLEAFYLDGKCFGKFHHDLQGFEGKLEDTIPHFHDTPLRFTSFQEKISQDPVKRVEGCKEVIDELLAFKEIAYYPMRQSDLAHNDAKLANVLFDQDTKEAICIIDLDTMMNGSIGYDFGDAIRSGCNPLKEDDPHFDQINFQMDYFESFTKGFLSGLVEYDEEVLDQLEKGIYVIIYEQAIRFLTDYLDGDHYYGIEYPTHNLVRTMNQLSLLKSAMNKKEKIHASFELYKRK